MNTLVILMVVFAFLADGASSHSPWLGMVFGALALVCLAILMFNDPDNKNLD